MTIRTVFFILKMLYHIIWFSASLLSFLFNTFWLCCTLAASGIPWFTLSLIIICIASKFCKLKNPNEKQLISLLGGDLVEEVAYWPIAHRGGAYDAPENSAAAIKRCSMKGLRNIFLDAAITANGEVVIAHQSTLEKAGLLQSINKIKYEDLQNVNISDHHPLGSQFDEQKIMTLTDLYTILESTSLTVFLLISDNSSNMIEKIKTIVRNTNHFTRQFILISKSPIAIYQLRKDCPELICGLWLDKSPNRVVLQSSTLIASIYGAILRNIIAPVIGISIVFVNKDEFNFQIAELWRNVGVRPVVYKVNSPNEKRYFQKIMKTQYLTDSIRSEPQFLIRP